MASPIQVLILLLIIFICGFLFGWIAHEPKGKKIRRFMVKHSALHKLRIQRRLINLATLSKRYDWKGNIY